MAKIAINIGFGFFIAAGIWLAFCLILLPALIGRYKDMVERRKAYRKEIEEIQQSEKEE